MPFQLTGGRIIGIQESSHSRVSARCADDYFIFDDKRSAGSSIVLHLVGVLDIPYQLSGARIEAEQMGVVRFGVDKILPNCHTAAFVGCGIVQQSRTYRT